MKKSVTIFFALLLFCHFSTAQDTLYVYKANSTVDKFAIADIDSITFNNKSTYPIQDSVIDADFNVYHTVTIGTQVWMVENLKVTKLNDGTPISMIIEASVWSIISTPAFCYYNNNEAENKNKFGALYNWYAVKTGKLAPKGWHIPTDEEWTTLTTFLGGIADAGGKLKETGLLNWAEPNVGATNEYNFTALPGGNRGNNNGTFHETSIGGFWWTSTDINGYASYFRSIGSFSAGVGRSGSPHINGLSVRCIKD